MGSKGFTRVRFGGMMLLFLAFLVSFAFDTSHAMTLMSGIEHLGKIEMDRSVLRGADSLAAGPGGTLYVVDGLSNTIVQLDRNGNYLGKIPFMQVSAVAAGPDGTLYIGSHKDYSVAIYKDGEVSGYLGSGEKEFSSIRAIAVARDTGDIYVVDNVANVVKIYDASGKSLGGIEGLNLPVGIAIIGSEVYVVDAPEDIDDLNMKSTSTRICIFDRAGNLLLVSFNEIMTNKEGMFRPSGIAVDSKGRIYVSDVRQNAVFVYDRAGKLIGSLRGGTDEINGAVALTLSPDGILYLASSETHAIQMFTSMGR